VIHSASPIPASHVDPAKSEVSPRVLLFNFHGTLIHLGGALEIRVPLKKLPHLEKYLEIVWICLCALSVEFESLIDVFIILLHDNITLYFKLHMLIPILVDPVNLRERVFSLLKLRLSNEELNLS
jgi:hypothetical protein